MTTLFPLPERNETRLERAKREHCIWTHRSKHLEREHAWMAVKFDCDEDVLQAVELLGSECRLYDESGLTAEGATEAEAVIKLAKQCGLKITL